ncbi:hypothetical protein GQ44DRAFT_777074 [Phaeosphaeriaceae sp. PMI808]|nr:hypothetical protein GQ44DRAFT_777074 [Phaeosphaeriaceae sp. PMI808]
MAAVRTEVGSAAEPLLASSTVGTEEVDALVEGLYELTVNAKRDDENLLGTGVQSLDEALEGGFLDGTTIGVWGERNENEFCQTLLVSSLLQHPMSMAAVVDTTGNFDILRLYTLILSQLEKMPKEIEFVRSALGYKTGAQIEYIATRLLDHVKIMRVFDFVGVKEAISEIKDGLEGKLISSLGANEADGEAAQGSKLLAPESLHKRTVIADSEDEDDEEEMLFDTSPKTKTYLQPQHTITQEKSEQKFPEVNSPGKVKLILVDNLTYVFNPLLKKDYMQATTLASTFLHTLSRLTRTHSLHTILANPATVPPAPCHAPQQQIPQLSLPPSIFASTAPIPSLLNILSPYVDLGLLLSSMPRQKMDARVYYRDGGSGSKKLRGVEMVNIMEVMSDRSKGRVGAWGTYISSEQGLKGVS